MSGFTTFNAAGYGSGGVSGNVAFSYDPYYTASVPTQNIPSGTTNVVYTPGSFSFNGSTSLQVTNPQSPNLTYPIGTTSDGTTRTLATLTGDFTVEAWINPNAVGTGSYRGIISGIASPTDASNGWLFAFDNNAGALTWYFSSVFRLTSANNVVKPLVWQHVAYVRSGTTGTLYCNGVSVGTWTDTQTYPTTYQTILIGSWSSGNGPFNGSISQPRITLSALYTSNFVPNPNLGLAAETVFYAPALSSASIASDLSRSGQTISAYAGTMTYSATGPANAPASGLFLSDTTSGIQTAPTTAFNFGTGNFICEYWINMNYTSSLAQNLSYFSGSTFNIADVIYVPGGNGWGLYNFGIGDLTKTSSMVCSPNAWNHIAYGKSGGNLTLWVNGQQVATVASSASVGGGTPYWSFNRIGLSAKLSLGPVRVSNSAVYTTGTNFSPPTTFARTANTVFLLQGGNSLSAALTDQSVNAITVSAYGNTVSGSQNVNYGVPGNVIGDISGARNTGLTLRASGTGNAQGATFYNNYGGYWQFNGVTANTVIATTARVSNSQSSFSQSVWFQTSTANSVMTMFQNNVPPISSGSLLNGLLVNATGRLAFYTYTNVPVFGNAIGNVIDNKWHHGAVSYNSSTQTASLYLDGQLANTVTISGVPIVNYAGYWAISGITGSFLYGNNFTGNIGPTAVYTSPLTPTQISQIYNSQVTRFYANASTPGTAYYTYRDGSIQTFTVPSNVTQLTARVVGAAGGAGLTLAGAYVNTSGGGGANIQATLAVTPGQTLYLVVGKGGYSNVQTSGNISQGGGGAAGPYYAGTGQIPGSSGGGFTGIFTADPSTAANATVAQASAVLIAGGGGGGTGGGSLLLIGGNASATLSANSSPGIGSAGAGSTTALQVVANAISNGTTVTVNLSGGAAGNAVNFSVGCPVSIGGGTFSAAWIGNVVTANLTAITAVYGGGAATPAAATYTGTLVYAGGYNGANVQGYNGQGGGWATPSTGGWQGIVSAISYANNSARTMPTAGSALQGGTGGAGNQIFSTAATGAGGGGGYYGGGGGAFGSPASGSGAAGSGGGGSNYANSQLIIANTVSYGTLTRNSGATQINGNIYLSWNTNNITASNVAINIVATNTLSYPGTGNTVYDLSPNFNNGTLSNVTYTNPAFNFNGANSYISVNDAASLEPGSGDWTMEAWVNTNTLTGAHVALIKTNNGGAAGVLAYAMRQSGTEIRGEFGNGSTAITATGIPLSINTWTHIVIVYQSVGQKLVLNYKNGQYTSQYAHAFTSILNTTRPLSIGSYNLNEFAQQWSGQIGTVKLYNYALSAGEVLASYNATRNTYETVPPVVNVLDYEPNNTSSYPGSGTTINNLAPTTLSGTLSNVTFTSPGFTFNGTTSYISVPDNAVLEPGSGDWTMEAWVNTNTLTGSHVVLIKTNTGGVAASLGYLVRLVGSEIRGEFGDGTTTITATGVPIPINTWVHVVVTWENVSQNLIVTYLNGQVGSQTAHSLASIRNTTQPLSIGSYNLNEFAQQWSGQIGIVKLYNYALNATQVQASYSDTRGIYGV